MKKVLCNKDGKFLSVHDRDCILTELEDGTIVIYKESEEDPLLENIYSMPIIKTEAFFFQKKQFFFS